MIEPVTVEMIDSIADDLGRSFYMECDLPGGFKLEVFRHNWSVLLKANIGVMWKLTIDDVAAGFLGGILLPDINDGEMVASEMFWYVHPAYRKTMWGLRLFSTFERWAKDIGAKRITMVHLMTASGESIGKLYSRKGYRLVEQRYMKEI